MAELNLKGPLSTCKRNYDSPLATSTAVMAMPSAISQAPRTMVAIYSGS